MPVSSTFVATDGDGYELTMGRWSRLLAEPFLDFVGTADHRRVLDLGCGTGHLAAAIARRSEPSEVHAVDLSAVYVEYAKARHSDARLVFRTGDACALDHPGGSFDQVLSLPMLHFVPRTDAERDRLETALRAAYLDGEPDGPRSYAALAWAVKGLAP
ncbi:MAG TPA: class I SAM-dependent methyltransferase [Methylibium sp.]|nr:class I SAM-dependent methyltransferase [Methylibium sp.]